MKWDEWLSNLDGSVKAMPNGTDKMVDEAIGMIHGATDSKLLGIVNQVLEVLSKNKVPTLVGVTLLMRVAYQALCQELGAGFAKAGKAFFPIAMSIIVADELIERFIEGKMTDTDKQVANKLGLPIEKMAEVQKRGRTIKTNTKEKEGENVSGLEWWKR